MGLNIFYLAAITFMLASAYAINQDPSSSGVVLDGGPKHDKYQAGDCKVAVECTPCTFSEMKDLRECLAHGAIMKESCVRVNIDDETDRISYTVTKACHGHGAQEYYVYMFFFCIIISLCG